MDQEVEAKRLPRTRGDGPPVSPGVMPLAGLPRTRGDGPVDWVRVSCTNAAAPHARGWTPGCLRASIRTARLPRRRAGMDDDDIYVERVA